MRRGDKKLNMIKANLLAEQRYLESKGIVKEVEQDVIVLNGLDEFKNEINKAGFDSEMCLVDECFKVIFKNEQPLDIVRDNLSYGSYLSHSDELVNAFNEKMRMVGYPVELSAEQINKLIILFIIIKNSESIESVIKDINQDKIVVDSYMLYKYINLYNIEDGTILRGIDKGFVEQYKDLI